MKQRERYAILLASFVLLSALLLLAIAPETLTAAPHYIRERISIDAGEDVWLHGGADLTVYSDDHSSTVWTLDGATGAVVGAGYDFQGGVLDLDADNDTSITADTDDQIDVEIAAADEFVFTADQLDVTNGQIVNIGAAGTDFSSTGGLTLADQLTVSSGGLTLSDGDAVIADDVRITAQTSVTITQGATLTPTGTYQPITAAGNLSFGSIVAGTAGDMLILINSSSNTITITDTGTLKLSGNAALGQYDGIVLFSDGTNWIELAQQDN